MYDFIIYTLLFTFSLALFLTWRENRIKRDIERDLKEEWYEKNRIKRP